MLKHLSIALTLASSSAYADDGSCQQLWFARNAMMDHVGYCFESPLGKALFDNSDCTTSSPVLSTAAAAMVAQIKRNEAFLGCSIDTSTTNTRPFQYDSFDEMRPLEVTPPVPTTWAAEWSCIGYIGAPLAVRIAPRHDADMVGLLQPGGIIDLNRDVVVEDGTYAVLRQLLMIGDDVHLTEEPIPEGYYWEFINTRDDHSENTRQLAGWAYLPKGINYCENAAG